MNHALQDTIVFYIIILFDSFNLAKFLW